MGFLEAAGYAAQAVTNPVLLLYLAAGVFLGIYIGAVPGLSVTMAASLLISFTYSWDMLPAMAAMVGIYIGGVYGGSRSAILLNIPGAPAAVATALEGYPLAKKGLAGQAIGVTVIQSVLGGFIGTLILCFGAPYLSKFAMGFAPRDYFLLAVMGLLLVGSLGNESPARGVLSAAIGLFVGFVGLDSQTGHTRFVLGPNGSMFRTYMMLGVSYVVVMIGLFGMSEALIQLRDLSARPVKQKADKIIPSWKNTVRFIPLTLKSSLIGAVVGALPGTGGDIAALLAYDQAKRGGVGRAGGSGERQQRGRRRRVHPYAVHGDSRRRGNGHYAGRHVYPRTEPWPFADDQPSRCILLYHRRHVRGEYFPAALWFYRH